MQVSTQGQAYSTRITVGIETRFEFFCSCLHLPNDILVTKTVLRLMKWGNWIYCILRAKIVYKLVQQGKAPTPSSGIIIIIIILFKVGMYKIVL